jgi:hypothetical protein
MPATPPRPFTKTEQVLTTLTLEDRERLDAAALRQRKSRAELVRTYILDGLDEDDAERGADR